MSVDALVEDLWGEEPPHTAVKMIHVAVSQLRKVLPDGVLETRAPGYRLRIGDGACDLQRFERLRAQGRLREALALWRGPALAEFAEPFADREADRLEDCASSAWRTASRTISRAASTARSSRRSRASSPRTRCASGRGAS